MRSKHAWTWCAGLLGVTALVLGGCAGEIDDDDDVGDDDLEVVEAVESELSLDATMGPNGRDCVGGHARRHKKHKWKLLDRLDGTKDRVITLATLPQPLPAKLLARLAEIDTNDDGLVTRDEVKAGLPRRCEGHRHDGRR